MILERYILRNYIGPFLFSVSVITFLFIMDFILKYIELFMNKGVPFLIVLQAFILSLGHMFALIIPMAVLPATLMAFGSLASENEITALRASGVSLYRIILPGFLGGVVLTIAMILFNNYVLPESNHKLLNLLIDINKKQPTVEIKQNVFIDAFKDHTIYIRHKDDKTGKLRDVQIFRTDKPGALPTTIVAKRGRLKYIEQGHILEFELEDGEIHETPQDNDPATYRRTEFSHYVIRIKDVDRSLKRSERNYRGDREMSVQQMQEKIESIRADIAQISTKMSSMAHTQVTRMLDLINPVVRDSVLGAQAAQTNDAGSRRRADSRIVASASTSKTRPSVQRSRAGTTYRALDNQREIKESYLRQINRYRVEIHKKYSIPFACIVFILIGSPLAFRLGKAGMNTAVALSILVFIVYYVCLIGGEKLADRRMVSPIFAMWIPNVVFALCAAVLIRSAAREKEGIRLDRFNPLRLMNRGVNQ